jgi:acyl-coenzyme A synthetase/AMP-(fatty) acid ligase
VVISRTALAHHVVTAAAVYGLTPADRALVFAQPSFDVSLEEMLPPLVQGAALVTTAQAIPAGAELVAILAVHRVTVANLPTSYLVVFAGDFRAALASGRWQPRLLIIGGERIPAASLHGIAGLPAATLLNAYGVTEATITSTVHQVSAADLIEGADIPLGRELPGTGVHILDAALQPLPDGAVGEIAIAGAGLATGYLGDEAATVDRFPAVSALAGERVYLTGDIGYRDTGGLLWFVGRRDNQVKLRGYRIELEEVEAAASAVLGGRPCAVVLDERGPDAPRLVGFVAGDAEPDGDALQAALARRLPHSMLPADWIRLDSLPVLAGGKPDRRSLAGLATVPRSLAGPPEDARAEGDGRVLDLVSAGWLHVLGHGRFTAASNFFQVGGHSLVAVQLAAWLEPRLGSRPRLHVLFQHPVLADLARVLAGEARE